LRQVRNLVTRCPIAGSIVFPDRKALGDLVGRGQFVLIAGEHGRAWVDAA
jgi:hypothetical protein